MEQHARAAAFVFVTGLVVCLDIGALARTSDPVVSASATAPEKPIRILWTQDRALQETYDRADALLSAGRVQESIGQFGIVAKLAGEPLRSRALLKFGYAAHILDDPSARGALTAAAQTTVPAPEGREIRTFAQRVLERTEKPELLIAPPKSPSGFLPPPPAIHPGSLWERLNEVEVLRRKGRLSLSIRQCRDLMAVYPDHPVILNNLALLLADVDPSEAEPLIRRAFKSAGAEKYVEYLYDTLGYVLLRQGQAVESIEHFRHSLSMRETAERNLHMAMALETLGQPDAAEQYRTRAGALDVTGDLTGIK